VYQAQTTNKESLPNKQQTTNNEVAKFIPRKLPHGKIVQDKNQRYKILASKH
jgi:hypothetical protein